MRAPMRSPMRSMHLIVVLAVLVSAAAYLDLLPEAASVANVPLSLVAGGIVAAGMLYVLARA